HGGGDEPDPIRGRIDVAHMHLAVVPPIRAATTLARQCNAAARARRGRATMLPLRLVAEMERRWSRLAVPLSRRGCGRRSAWPSGLSQSALDVHPTVSSAPLTTSLPARYARR